MSKEIDSMVLYYNEKPVAYLLDIEGFKAFIEENDSSKLIRDVNKQNRQKSIKDFQGVFNQYSDIQKIKEEKNAWQKHAKDKHAR